MYSQVIIRSFSDFVILLSLCAKMFQILNCIAFIHSVDVWGVHFVRALFLSLSLSFSLSLSLYFV